MSRNFMLLCVLAWFYSPAYAKNAGDSTADFTISIQNIISLQPYQLYGKIRESATMFLIVTDTQLAVKKTGDIAPVLYVFAQKGSLSTDTITIQATENTSLQFTGIQAGKLKYISAESMQPGTADSLLEILNHPNEKAGNTAWYRRNEIFISLGLVFVAAFLIWKLYKRKKRNNNLTDEV